MGKLFDLMHFEGDFRKIIPLSVFIKKVVFKLEKHQKN